jgi:Leucine-rich repeat (LRR) protein
VQTAELQKLILAHNNLEALKEDLRNLTSLTVLNISHNRISTLPSAIGELVVSVLVKSLKLCNFCQ